jgi:hypothetical protein
MLNLSEKRLLLKTLQSNFSTTTKLSENVAFLKVPGKSCCFFDVIGTKIEVETKTVFNALKRYQSVGFVNG